MKVLQINSVCGVGSTGRIVTDIDSKLKENNIESYIAYGRNTSIDNDNILRIGTKLDYYIHGALTRIFDTHALWGSKRATKEFIKKVKEIDPDVIHLHNLHGYYINIKILFDYLKESDKPVVWTLHDCWSFTGHCAHFSYAGCYKWIDCCYDCPQRKAYPTSIVFDNSYKNYNEKKKLFTSLSNVTIITPSVWLADLVKKSFLSVYPVRVIHNGIDTDIFKPVNVEKIRQKYGLNNKFIILGVANIWSKSKGLQYFLELSKLIEDDSLIMIVGLNDKQIKSLPDNIIGIKRTSDINELVQLYAVADVFVNPTLDDNFPTVNLEALACGTPIITFKTGGSGEMIEDGCGYISEQGSVSAMELINQLKKNGKEVYIRNCVANVKNNFNKADKFKEYFYLYKQLKLDK